MTQTRTLSDRLGHHVVVLLRQFYVIDRESSDVLSTPAAKATMRQLNRVLVHEQRTLNHKCSTSERVVWDEDMTRHAVWCDFVKEKIDEGYTTGDLAKEFSIGLDVLNAYMLPYVPVNKWSGTQQKG